MLSYNSVIRSHIFPLGCYYEVIVPLVQYIPFSFGPNLMFNLVQYILFSSGSNLMFDDVP